MAQITVSAGSTTTITLAADQKVILTGQGIYRVSGLGGSQRPTVDESIDTTSTVGPFGDYCTVQIWGAGSGAFYDIVLPTDTLDLNGRPYEMGGSADSKTSPNTIVLIGDSITNNSNINNGQTGTSNFTRQFRTSDIGWFTWANIMLGGAFKVLRNSGRAGDTTGDMRGRMQEEVLPYSPSFILIAGGINDRQLGGQPDLGYDYSTGNIQYMAEQGLAIGAKVIIATILPNNAINSLGAGNIKVENLLRINDWIRRYAETTRGVYCLDVYSSIYDQTKLCGERTGSFTDSTHPGVIGAYDVGAAAAKILANIVKPRPVVAALGNIATTTNPGGNLVRYSSMGGTTGTMPATYTPTLNGVTITGTAGQFSCNATSLVVGQTVTISGTAGGTGSITGYSNPTVYYIIATNGSTTFTLSATAGGAAIGTTAGTPTGLTYTVSGSVPDGWWLQNDGSAVANVAHTAVMTRPARSDYPGLSWWQSTVTFSTAQAAVTVFTFRLTSAATLTIPSSVVAGDLIDCSIEIEYSNVTNCGALTVEFVARQGTTDLTFTDGKFDSGFTYSAGLLSGQSPTTPTPAFAGVVTANGMPLPANCDNIMVRVQTRNLAGTNGGFTMRLGRVVAAKRV